MHSDTPIPTQTPLSSPEPLATNLQPPSPFAYRGNGKVARLPKPIRDSISNWLLDGLSYPDIIQRLGDQGKNLTPDNLSQWKKRGHQDWLLEQAWLAQTRAQQEPAVGLATDFDATQVNHAALQLGSLAIFEALRDLLPSPSSSSSPPDTTDNAPPEREPPADPSLHAPERNDEVNSAVLTPTPPKSGRPPLPICADTGTDPTGHAKYSPNHNSKTKNRKSSLDFRLGGDSGAFVRLINALARASRETMLVQKYRQACANARAALNPMKDPKRKLTESERRAIVLEVDDILGLSSESGDSPSPDDPIPAHNGAPRAPSASTVGTPPLHAPSQI